MFTELPGVLGKICANKVKEVQALAASDHAFIRDASFGPVRDFYAALSAPGRRFIMECKRVSPSQGTLRADFSLTELADAYGGIADVISVLTDERYFGGSLGHIAEVRQRVSVPVLRKDFILQPIQVREAWAVGADAVLLMLSVLDDDTYRACAFEAHTHGLGILTEVHTQEEAIRAVDLGARVIGINNRDLRTLEVDLTTTARIAALIPSDRVVVSESGIRNHEDVKTLSPHANAFLVGSSLMKSPSVALAARELAFGAVKVCGLTRSEDALAAYIHGASYGGLIFAENSKRQIDVTQAKAIMRAAPLRYVGVFAGQTPEAVIRTQQALKLHALQLHGDYSASDIRKVQSACNDCEIWQVQRMNSDQDVVELIADRLLLDSAIGGALGGNGTTFDWTILNKIGDKSALILAGGLSPENIAQAAATGAGILDVNSGVEAAPGIKDPYKLQQLFNALRRTEVNIL